MTRNPRCAPRLFSVVVLAAGFIAVQLFAQPQEPPAPQQQPQGPRGGRGARGGQLFPVQERGLQFVDQIGAACAELRLSNEQISQVNLILDAARQQLRGMSADLGPFGPQERRQRVAAHLNGVADKIKPILTSDQLRAFEPRFVQLMRGFTTQPPPPPPQVSPSTRPGEMQPGNPQPPRLGVLMERLGDYVGQIDLSDEQKAQVQKLFADTRQKLEALRQQAQAAAPQMMERAQESAQQMVQEMRQQLGTILTSKQAEHLRDLINSGGGMENPAPNRGGRGGRGARGPRSGAGANPDAPMMGDGMMQPGQAAAAAPAASAMPDVPLIDIGKDAPDFALRKLENAQTVPLSSMKGKVVLLVFGSYTSPSFRQRAAALETLRQNLGTKISVYVIYTRENYPIGQWNVDRNKSDGVLVEQPTEMEGRLAIAKQVKTTLKLTVPILMDSMDDATAKAYGGFTNTAVLIGRDGKVIAHQKWFEPYALRRMIDDALKPAQATPAGE